MPDRITSGVVFTTPPSLPRGRHVLSRAEVTAAQRERMLIAATELLAGVGYRGFGVREICARAAVSRAAFYACFADKDACVYAAYDRFIAVFLRRLATSAQPPATSAQTPATSAQAPATSGQAPATGTGEQAALGGERCAGDAAGDGWAACVRGFVVSYLETLQRDLVAARAFQVEMDALGRPARERRRAALTELAGYVRTVRSQRFPGTGDAVPFSAYLGAVHALRQSASDALDATPAPDLPAMADELAPWLCRMVEA